MDPELVLIFSFIIIMTVILGITVNGIVQKVLDHKRAISTKGEPPAKIAEINERTALIEDRLAVLERIATDPEARRGAELAQEIEQLRIETKQK